MPRSTVALDTDMEAGNINSVIIMWTQLLTDDSNQFGDKEVHVTLTGPRRKIKRTIIEALRSVTGSHPVAHKACESSGYCTCTPCSIILIFEVGLTMAT
jgi:hypothetical protein